MGHLKIVERIRWDGVGKVELVPMLLDQPGSLCEPITLHPGDEKAVSETFPIIGTEPFVVAVKDGEPFTMGKVTLVGSRFSPSAG